MEMLLQIILITIGFIMLIKGADWFVEGTSGIASRFGIPQIVIGLTIVAMGTSAPEAAVSITSALKNSADITIGNIVGSNILNILIILGITSVIVTIQVSKSTIRQEIPYMIGITLLLLILGYTGNKVNRWEGILFLGIFALYLFHLYKVSKQHKEEADVKAQSQPFGKLLLASAIGLILIIAGSNLAVDAAAAVAEAAGVSERFIGLTIVALGTSLPELFTSVSAALKGKADIAIGNIVGSNIFNILFVIGISSLILPVTFAPDFIMDTLIAIGSAVLLFLCVFRKEQLKRAAGIIMLLAYLGYFIFLLR